MRYNFAIKKEEVKGGIRYLFVDTSKAEFMRMGWDDLGDWGKKKFETFLFLTKMHDSKEKLKIKYVQTV